MPKPKRVFIIGTGGREHALAWYFKKQGVEVFCAPGNEGMRMVANFLEKVPQSLAEWARAAQEQEIDLTVVGPEQLIVDGIVDQFDRRGLLICAPNIVGAQAEGSKTWFDALCRKNGIKVPEGEAFTIDSLHEALGYMLDIGAENCVIKADGLCAGKGAVLPKDDKEAEQVIREMLEGRKFDAASDRILIQERIKNGVELSMIAITDGYLFHMLPFTKDYKCLLDGDKGPNTGGMGAHTVKVTPYERKRYEAIMGNVIQALAEVDGCVYRGPIYLGLMIAEDGTIYVLECNVRLGDPETQSIMMAIEGDLFSVLEAAARGNLRNADRLVQTSEALGVVMASYEYPGKSNANDNIMSTVIEANGVFHANTSYRCIEIRHGFYTTNGSGRILSVNRNAVELSDARRLVYDMIQNISFPGVQWRADIGEQAVITQATAMK